MGYKVLNNIEAVRTRPEMYAGDLSTPDHLATEILDNALDEIVNGFATRIDLYYNSEEGSFWCSDNGRGLEVTLIDLPDGTKEDSVKALCTYLHSGSKFDNVDYDQLIGIHGVGLVVTNALSEWLIIKTRDRLDKKKIYIYTFNDAELVSKVEEYNDDTNWSTIVGFKPNPKYFNSVQFDIKSFIERLIFVQTIYNSDDFTINNSPIPKLNLEDYIRQLLQIESDLPLYELSYQQNQNTNIRIILTYLENDNNNVTIGNVNLRFCDGKYITTFHNELKRAILDKIDKKFAKLPDREFLSGLRAFIFINIPEPKFDGQIKSRMILDVKNILIDPLKSQINWFVDQVIDIIQSNLENKIYGKVIGNSKTSKLRKISAANKLKDCLRSPGEVLYIVEGDSAGGTLNQVRDKATEAYFPLKGKLLNVENATLDQIKNNKEISFLLEALGSASARRYKHVKILADADEDGKHITVLTLLVLLKFAPDLIKNGRVSVIIPPLFGAEKGNKYIPIYNKARIPEFEKNGYIITRFKGLGEMDKTQLEACIRSGFEYHVKWPRSDQDLENIKELITNTELKRAIMNNSSVKMDVIMNEIINNLKQKTKQ